MLRRGPDRRDAAAGDARQGARRDAADHRRPAGGDGGLVPRASWQRELAGKADAEARVLDVLGRHRGPGRRARHRAGALGARQQRSTPPPRNALENTGRALRVAHARRARRVGGAAHRSRGAGRRASHATRRGCSRPASSTTSTAGASSAIACAPAGAATTRTRRSRSTPRTTRCCCASTSASAAGCPPGAGKAKSALAYEHLMIDEVQDFSPLELAVLLDATTRAALGHAGGRHGAGDRARARLLELGRAARLSRHRARARRAAARELPLDARDRRRRRARARAR